MKLNISTTNIRSLFRLSSGNSKFTVLQKWGVILFALYVSQCALGAFIHWVKPKNSQGRPLQNYLHAVFGLILIALGFFQVRTGYKTEWPKAVGRGDLMEGADFMWYTWILVSQNNMS